MVRPAAPSVELAGPLHDLLEAALHVPGATFTIYRERLLAAFSTDRLVQDAADAGDAGEPLLEPVEHVGYTSWRLGDRDGHACYVDPGAIRGVHFSAEAFDCLGGRTNLIVWFLTDFDTGCPTAPEAYASVTLDDPYRDGEPVARFGAVLELYRAFRDRDGVTADPAFLTLAEGPAAA